MSRGRAITALYAPLVLAAALWPVAINPGVACAANAPRASLVVDTGTNVLNYCVTLPDKTVSGMELIELASEQHGLNYKLGFGGAAVCMLAGVGPTGSDCFEQDPDFWGYWRSDGSGGWMWSGSGATTTSVDDGDVEGWAWGSGTGPDTHPAPPHTDFDDVCVEIKSPAKDEETTEERSSSGTESSPPAAQPGGSSESIADEGESKQPAEKVRQKVRGRSSPARDGGRSKYVVPVTATPTPTPAARAAPIELVSDDGPPIGGIVAIVATGALGAAAVVVGRRRRGAP